MNKDFIIITITDKDSHESTATLRKSKVVALTLSGEIVGVLLDGIETPFTFTLATPQAAKNLYEQIENGW